MNKTELKEILKQYYKIQIQYIYLSEHTTIHTDKLKQNQQTYEIINDALSILNEKELFLIQYHLIEHHTWKETDLFIAKVYGDFYRRSDRTLKRKQNIALEKMIDFVNKVYLI